jgi:hypothetical protein
MLAAKFLPLPDLPGKFLLQRGNDFGRGHEKEFFDGITEFQIGLTGLEEGMDFCGGTARKAVQNMAISPTIGMQKWNVRPQGCERGNVTRKKKELIPRKNRQTIRLNCQTHTNHKMARPSIRHFAKPEKLCEKLPIIVAGKATITKIRATQRIAKSNL